MSPGAGSPRASWGGEGGPMGRPSDAGSRARTSQQHQQAAAAGQYSYESLDYEVVDNVVYRADEASCTHFDVIVRGGVKWLMCFLIGGFAFKPAACQQLAAQGGPDVHLPRWNHLHCGRPHSMHSSSPCV